jgi:hypothetical protein
MKTFASGSSQSITSPSLVLSTDILWVRPETTRLHTPRLRPFVSGNSPGVLELALQQLLQLVEEDRQLTAHLGIYDLLPLP